MVTSQPLELREKIIHEATRLFVERGYHGISMREIAEATGLSKAGLYYHFVDKEDLFLAILGVSLDRMESIIEISRREAGVRAQVKTLLLEIFKLPQEQRAVIRLANQDMQHISEEARAKFGRVYQSRFVGLIESMLTDGIARGELAPMDVRVGTWLLLGMIYPFLYPSSERTSTHTSDAVNLALRIFFDGALSKP